MPILSPDDGSMILNCDRCRIASRRRFLADVKLIGRECGDQIGYMVFLDCRHDIDIVGQAGLTLSHGGNRAGDKVGDVQTLQERDYPLEQIMWLHAETSRQPRLEPLSDPSPGECAGCAP